MMEFYLLQKGTTLHKEQAHHGTGQATTLGSFPEWRMAFWGDIKLYSVMWVNPAMGRSVYLASSSLIPFPAREDGWLPCRSRSRQERGGKEDFPPLPPRKPTCFVWDRALSGLQRKKNPPLSPPLSFFQVLFRKYSASAALMGFFCFLPLFYRSFFKCFLIALGDRPNKVPMSYGCKGCITWHTGFLSNLK